MKTYTKAEAGAKGGSARTPEKAKASAANGAAPCHDGKTRGRPRKITSIRITHKGEAAEVKHRTTNRGYYDPLTLPTLGGIKGGGGKGSLVGYIIHAEAIKPSCHH